MSETVNCKEACINGCILGDRCPNLEYLAATRKFLQDTSIDKILEIAANRFFPKEIETEGDRPH
ncbi:hypothetical protein V2H45_01100 [Tumidithrix elongata RA019]|uniref:Uncharacterized protein n=1 Tax=Tumidithrix elongata BACA0141 TaxID=2716417 RepID=A0AAW9PSK7_9CYAN|nr:hypothetical protein [Tumidithrix elongata RA019]